MKQAATWMKRVADETNDAEAMIKLASMFDEGIGVSADKAKAVHYYKQAADLGHAEAQYQLGKAENKTLSRCKPNSLKIQNFC